MEYSFNTTNTVIKHGPFLKKDYDPRFLLGQTSPRGLKPPLSQACEAHSADRSALGSGRDPEAPERRGPAPGGSGECPCVPHIHGVPWNSQRLNLEAFVYQGRFKFPPCSSGSAKWGQAGRPGRVRTQTLDRLFRLYLNKTYSTVHLK